jgi:hypothetical protein
LLTWAVFAVSPQYTYSHMLHSCRSR